MTAQSTVQLDPRVARLISPLGGVISGLEQLAPGLTRSGETVTLARLGEVGRLDPSSTMHFGSELDGIGCHTEPSVAAHIAAMEALERYGAAVGGERCWITATAASLGDDALALEGLARCSAAETARPEFPLTAWDRHQPLRWTRGWSLVSGRQLWVPAVLAYLGVTPIHPVESFCLQSSSGCAIGESEEDALLGACRELVERDAVAIAWLHRLPLPRIEVEDGPPATAWETVRRALAKDDDRQRISLFDATTDLGIPTVLAVALPPHHRDVMPAVGAACADSLAAAAARALRELSIVRGFTW
jgi:ribosomal protein S12 methylthiotransferase accessory factor